MKNFLIALVLLITINHEAFGRIYYIYFPMPQDFDIQALIQKMESAYTQGARPLTPGTGDEILDLYNSLRYAPNSGYFLLMFNRLNSIIDLTGGPLNGAILYIDPDNTIYPLRPNIRSAAVRITDTNDPTQAARHMLRALYNNIPTTPNSGSYAQIAGLPDPNTGAPTMIQNQTIIRGAIYQNGQQIYISDNPHYVRQTHDLVGMYPFRVSPQVFPVTTVAVTPNTDVPYAEACGNSTAWPSNISRMPVSTVPNKPVCASPPESISIEEFLKRGARHHATKSLPAWLSLLL